MNTILVFLIIGAGVAAAALCTPGLRERTGVGEAMSVGMTGSVFSGLVTLSIGGHDLSGPIPAICCGASALGAAVLLWITLSAGEPRSTSRRETR
ncbi:hypothetical protein [Arthrobacter sp. efr-133-TYG-120]|uniref:hypothetical protein n=1 Tax=Arthrobacter sp. efr-133-TYG-120 TaxID=3040280 RepID=UPI00254E1F4A|nr:hypothetical protein [Arthrobacter sp. efr-133-TYG-120]